MIHTSIHMYIIIIDESPESKRLNLLFSLVQYFSFTFSGQVHRPEVLLSQSLLDITDKMFLQCRLLLLQDYSAGF